MKNKIVLIAVATAVFIGADMMNKASVSSTAGAPAGTTGSPGDGNATCRNCHTGALLQTGGTLTSTVPGTGYITGQTYTVTATIVRAGHVKFGFEASPQSLTGVTLGTMINITQTQLLSLGKYITHTSAGVGGSGSKTWNFKWQPPNAGTGPVTFYACFNATNNNASSSGDTIFHTTLVISEDASNGIAEAAGVKNFHAYPNPAHQHLNITYVLDGYQKVTIQLYDLKGELTQTLLSEDRSSGTCFESLELNAVPPGVYLLMVTAGERASVSKIIIQ